MCAYASSSLQYIIWNDESMFASHTTLLGFLKGGVAARFDLFKWVILKFIFCKHELLRLMKMVRREMFVVVGWPLVEIAVKEI